MLILVLLTRDFQTGGGYPFVRNSDKAKDDVDSKSANISNNDAVNNNVKDNSSANNSTDVKNDAVATYKSVRAVKEDSVQAAKEDKAAAESPANVDKQSEVKPNKDGIYDFSNDKDIKNPFPNVITPAEVKELQDKTTSGYPFSYIIKSFYTPAGKEFKVVNGKPVGDTQEFTYQIQNTYENMLGRIDNYIFIPSAKKAYGGEGEIRPYRSSREFRNDDGSLSLDGSKAPATVIPYTLEINGKFIGKDRTTKTPFEYYMHKNQTFVHMTMYGRKADEIIYGAQSLNYMGSSAAPGLFAFIPECGAQFHFVDDLQYRKVANIKGNGELSQRSTDGADRFSTKPFTKLAITDLQDSSNVSNVKFANNAITNYFVPLLSYEGDPKKDSVKRPTMEELKKTNIPGYLYYSNDIDTPKDKDGKFKFTKDNTENFGNYDYGIVRDEKDNQVTTKHYYVTFRVVPTQLVVKYKKSDGTFEANAKYELLDSNNTQISDQFVAASKDIAASNKDALAAMMKLDKTTFIKYSTGLSTGYLSNGAVYLLPGNYTVKPTAAITDSNYEWVVESDDLAYAPKNANIDILVHKDDSISTQKVVTFVLTKKTATVTFMNGDSVYAKVKVQKTMSIDTDALTSQSMPSNPSKAGYTFVEWSSDKTGNDASKVFTGTTPVTDNMTVYAIYTNYPPTLTLQDKTITEGDPLDLNSLIVSAQDSEDGDLTSKVKLTNNGGFDNTKVGSYKVTFSVTDNGGYSATASATVTVAKKPVPLTKLNIAPTLTLQDKTITEGDSLDLKTLVVSAQDPEDGDLTSKVKLTDNGGFDNTKVGSYKVTFSVTDSGKASVVKSATVTVAEKPEEPIPDIDWDDIPTPDTTPDTEPIPTLTPIPTPTPVPVPQLTPAPVTPTPEQPTQPTQPVSHTPAHAAKHLPQTGASMASILAIAIASLFAGLTALSATTNRKH